MFKRILNWFRIPKSEIPADARWVIEGNKYVLVTPGEVGTGLSVLKTIRTQEVKEGEGRPSRVVPHRDAVAADRANRQWIAEQAPDVCLFL